MLLVLGLSEGPGPVAGSCRGLLPFLSPDLVQAPCCRLSAVSAPPPTIPLAPPSLTPMLATRTNQLNHTCSSVCNSCNFYPKQQTMVHLRDVIGTGHWRPCIRLGSTTEIGAPLTVLICFQLHYNARIVNFGSE